MRYAVIMAGGSGTRLWPMSRARFPKQLIPFSNGKSLLQLAVDRLEGLIPTQQQYICAGQAHRDLVVETIRGTAAERFLAEPVGRDTLNAVGLSAGEIFRSDPEGVIAVFTADHIIEPTDQFQQIVAQGFELVESHPHMLATFGIEPTHPATAYGYVQLGEPIGCSFVVDQFKEKPGLVIAQRYIAAGADRYLWNSGMFVWRARTLLDCIRRYAPENHTGLSRIADAPNPEARGAILAEVYPTLPKISVDYAVMEPASRDPAVTVAVVPMPLTWLDVGSWSAFAQTCDKDDGGNALGAGKHVLLDSTNTLVASDDSEHLIAALGCEDLVIIHTNDVTLVCRSDRVEDLKKLHALVGERIGEQML